MVGYSARAHASRSEWPSGGSAALPQIVLPGIYGL